MKIPTYQQFISPLLKYLSSDCKPHKSSEVYDGVSSLVGLSDDDKAILLPSGIQAVYKNRIGWAQDATKRAELTFSPSRGIWQISDLGKELIQKHNGILPEEISKEIATTKRNIPIIEIQGGEEQLVSDETSEASPEEKIDSGLKEINESIISELLERISEITPQEFEKLVLDVLHTMGYGTDRSDLQNVGKSHDEGIDGIISLDKLGLEKVYVQAKRWKNQVGSPEVQTFMGALQLKGANKGVLISSGPITAPAYELAKQAHGNLVLINGTRLAALMIEYGIGVQHRIIKIAKVDQDYFE